MKRLLLFSIIWAVSFKLFASSELNLNGIKYYQKGTFLLEVTVFKIDVYQISYLESSNSKILKLNYLRDVSKKMSHKGWDEGFKYLGKKLQEDNYKKAIKWIYDNTNDLKKGDEFIIESMANRINFYLNRKKIASTEDIVVHQIVMSPWIGEKPLDRKMKARLRGVK